MTEESHAPELTEILDALEKVHRLPSRKDRVRMQQTVANVYGLTVWQLIDLKAKYLESRL